MQDAIALNSGLTAHPTDLVAAFSHFESNRRQASSTFQAAAAKSLDWYENVAEKLYLEPVDFAVDYMCRTGQVDLEDLRKRDPYLVAAYESRSQLQLEPTLQSGL